MVGFRGAGRRVAGPRGLKRQAGSTGCTLPPSDLGQRRGRWLALLASDSHHDESDGDELRLRFLTTGGVRRKLTALVALERDCCSHLGWWVRPDGSDVVLAIRGDPPDLARLRRLLAVRHRSDQELARRSITH
ncbi:MAG TPA: hypothetical protein VEY07_09065 [Thermoplasmata archaeon]|nr:hypothetical protein [Thermoplasmata archaeon]